MSVGLHTKKLPGDTPRILQGVKAVQERDGWWGSFATSGPESPRDRSHGLRRGLYSGAATRLEYIAPANSLPPLVNPAPYTSLRRYNMPVPAAEPQPEDRSPERPGRNHIYTLEAAGILIIGALVLIFTLARYWHYIAWGDR